MVDAPNQLPKLPGPATRMPFGGGFDAQGEPTGRLYFSALLEDANRIIRSDLEFRSLFFDGNNVVSDAGGIRQIKTYNGLLDIQGGAGSPITINAYTVAAGLQPDATTGLYPLTGAALRVTQRIEAATYNNTPGVRYVTLAPDGTTTDDEAVFGESTDTYVYRRHEKDGQITETETFLTDIDATDPNQHAWKRTTEVTEKSVDAQGTEIVDNVIQREYRKSLALTEEVLDRLVEDPDGEARTTDYAWHEDPASPEVLGKRDWVRYPDGGWSRTQYDANGESVGTMRPWMDGPADPSQATPNNCRYTSYVPSGDPNLQGSWWRTNTESILGQLMDYSEERSFYLDDPEDNEKIYWVWSRSKGDADAGIHTESFYESDSEFQGRGRLKRRINPDGSMVNYPDENTVIYGREGSPEGLPFRTTKVVTLGDGGRETYVYTGGGNYALISTTEYTKDGEGRIIEVKENGVVVSETVYEADGDVVRTGRDGSVTRTEEDGERMVQVGVAAGPEWQAQPDVITETIEQADGSTKTLVTGGALSIETISGENFYTDATGATTTTTEANGGRTITQTGPGGSTVTTEHYLDGQIKSVTGPGVVDRYYTYAVVAGNIVETVHLGAPNSPRWRKTSTRAGRIIEVREPGPNGADLVTTHSRDELTGRTVVTRPGLAPQITERIGPAVTRTGFDMDGDGKLNPASIDRIRETETLYEQDGQDWRRVTIERAYLTDNQWMPTEIQRTAQKVGPVTDIVITKADGEVLTIAETVDRAAKLVTRTAQSNRSNLAGVEKIVNGLLVSRSTTSVAAPMLYQYDALRRLIAVIDPRTNLATTRSYNAAGQLESITDAAGNVESFGYYDAAHLNAGQMQWRENGLGKRVYYAYDAAGRRTHQWGSADYPLHHVYDDYGQMTELHTYRDDAPGMWMGVTPPGAFDTATPSVTQWIYDEGSGVLAQKLYADNQGPSYTYHDNGKVATRTWARGIVTTYAYNGAGELTGVDYSDATPDVAHTYHRDGRRKTTLDAAGLHTYHYDNPGSLPSGESITGGLLDGVSYRYPNDDFGRRRSFSAAKSGQQLIGVAYGYDSVNRLQTVTAGPLVNTYAYEPNSDLIATITGSRTGTGAGTMLTSTRIYDSVGRLDVISNVTATGEILSSHDYTYDAAHRRTRADRENGDHWAYAYNDRNEVTGGAKFRSNGDVYAGMDYNYLFDAIGNRISSTIGYESSSLQTTYTANALNQYTAIGNPGSVIVNGQANENASVTVNGNTATRQGAYWHRKVDADNSTGPVWANVDVEADLTGQISTGGGARYIPAATVAPTHDADGNQTFDGRWDYTWNGENRLIAAETSAIAETSGAPKAAGGICV